MGAGLLSCCPKMSLLNWNEVKNAVNNNSTYIYIYIYMKLYIEPPSPGTNEHPIA